MSLDTGEGWQRREQKRILWGTHYQAKTSEDIGYIACAVVRSGVGELVKASSLFVVASCKNSINQITKPNSVSGH